MIKISDLLEKLVREERKKLPNTLRAKDLAEYMNCRRDQVYHILNYEKIPGARKCKGLGWRIPRDTFLIWYLGGDNN